MKTTSYVMTPDGRWSAPHPTALDSESTLVLFFGGASLAANATPIEELRAAFPLAIIIGCSTSGEIHGASVTDEHVVVAVCRFERTRLSLATVKVGDFDGSFAAGRALGAMLLGQDLKAAFVISDGMLINGSALVKGLSEALPNRVPVTGGMAGDGTRFGSTWVSAGGPPEAGLIVALGFYGDNVVFRHGVGGGWIRFGPERLVTRSTDNVLYQLDGRPALELYKEYLGERAAGLPATAVLFPLAVRAHVTVEPMVRTIVSIDEEAQSLTFAGDIPQGSYAQLMRTNLDQLVQASSDAAMEATRGMSGEANADSLSIAVSCVGRRMALRDRCEEELEATLEYLSRVKTRVGFYSYGEISPLPDATCGLYNQSMTLTVISET